MTAHPLVLGTAQGYGIAQVRVFVESLRRHYAGDAALVVSPGTDPALFGYLRTHRVRPVFFGSGLWMPYDIQVMRYARYLDFLLTEGTAYDRVFLTDVGDVLFQGDPFARAPAGELVVMMEDPRATIATCPSNSRWIRNLYGEEGLAQLGPHPISCSGTTLGSRRAILGYIDLLLAQAQPQQLRNLPAGSRGHDQGMHNALLHGGRLGGVVRSPNGELVLTLGHVPDADVALREDGIALAGHDRLPPVVHQYQYKPSTAAHVVRLWPAPG
jgi:hypothetical protein